MIPLSIPNISGNEWQYVKECLDTGWISSVGAYVNRFEEALAEYTGARYAVATMNGTAALHIALKLAGVQPGDLVIVPNITFVASCNAITYAGATPLLIDIDPHTWQMDLDLLEEYLAAHTALNEGEKKNPSIPATQRSVHRSHYASTCARQYGEYGAADGNCQALSSSSGRRFHRSIGFVL